MRILILNWRDIKHEWAGGGEVYIDELARRWVKMGHQVTLFCGQDFKNKLPTEEIHHGIRTIRRGGRFSLYLWAFWLYVTRLRNECDVVVDVQNGIPFFTVLYSRKPKIAVVYHIHGKQFFIELPMPVSIIGYAVERYIFPFLYKRTTIQAISATTKKDLMEIGINEKNINIVYCGINGHKKGKNNGHKFTRPTILYLGRIKKYKRVELLIRVMPKVLNRIPDCRLIIAGWGTEASNITDAAMRSSYRRNVKIVGPVSESEKRNLLKKAWVFVNPSINEGWGISVIEANLYGTPAVAFKVQGLSESIKNNKTGILVNSTVELVDAIVKILTDGKLRHYLEKNAYTWAHSFSWDNSAELSIKLLKSKL